MKWLPLNSIPSKPGWFHVRDAPGGKIGIRYWDGKCWNAVNARDGFTPNDSFVEWLLIFGISRNQIT